MVAATGVEAAEAEELHAAQVDALEAATGVEEAPTGVETLTQADEALEDATEEALDQAAHVPLAEAREETDADLLLTVALLEEAVEEDHADQLPSAGLLSVVEDLAGAEEELVQAVQLEAAGVVVTLAVVVLAVVVWTVVELVHASQVCSASVVATAAAEAAPAKIAAATKDFILIVGFVLVLLKE